VAVAVGVGMLAVTVAICWLVLLNRMHSGLVVGADLLATILLTVASGGAQTAAQRHGGMPTLTTIWAAGPVIEAGLLAGWLAGLVAGALQLGSAVLVRDGYDGRTLSSGLILLVAGAVIGWSATIAARAETELAEAVRARAALTERERLTHTIHDGVLQVLALVHRAGRDEPGQWGALADAAGQQEIALRTLLTAPLAPAPEGSLDLAMALRARAGERVTVSAPAGALFLPAALTTDLDAAVGAALHNVIRHAGPTANAWVLIEDLDHEVRVTVRDDGAGFGPDRLAEAVAQGRLGVAASVRARIERLHGQVTIVSSPGAGTTVELSVPR
jgi:signal transduction histidine kinase